MNKRLIFFLLAVVAFVAALVYFEQQRQAPWNSPVFFSELTKPSIVDHLSPASGQLPTGAV